MIPSGFYDHLPDTAEPQLRLHTQCLAFLQQYGYRYVSLPLAMFAEAEDADSLRSIRFMDPVSQQTLALRTDVTPQVRRLSHTSLEAKGRPLRLCYAGPVVRARGTARHPQRQFHQLGFECFGTLPQAGLQEVLVLLKRLSQSLGLGALTLDLSYPDYIRQLVRNSGLKPEQQQACLVDAQHKRPLKAEELGASPDFCQQINTLIGLSASPETAKSQLKADQAWHDPLPALFEVIDLAQTLWPEVAQTVDLTEHADFPYQDGLCFRLYDSNSSEEVAKGGLYQVPVSGEIAVGCSLYLDAVRSTLTQDQDLGTVLITPETPEATCTALQQEGWRTVFAQQPSSSADSLATEAKRLGYQAYVADDIFYKIG